MEGDVSDTYYGDWRRTDTIKIQNAISELAKNLIFLKKVIESNNLLNAVESPIDKIQIAQLIALLESTLSAIKAPLVEAGQTSGFIRFLKKLAQKGTEKGMEEAVKHAVNGAIDSGSHFLHELSDAAGTSDIGTIIT